MKTTKIFYEMNAMILYLLFLIPSTGMGMQESRHTVVRGTAINPGTTFSIENKIGPMTFTTWDKDSVRIESLLVADGNPEEVAKLKAALDELQFHTYGETVTFDTRFYKSITSSIPGNTRIILTDGSIIKLSKFSLSYRVTVPVAAPLMITQKYDDLILPDLRGKLILNLYECDLKAGNFSSITTLNYKYGKGIIESTADLILNSYESKLEIRKTGNLVAESKYSSVRCSEALNLNLDLYEDEWTIEKHGEVQCKAKYSELVLKDAPVATFELYETEIRGGHYGQVTLTAKYSQIEFLSAGTADFREAYECRFTVPSLKELTAIAKYSEFDIYQLDGKLSVPSAYEGQISIKRIGKSFSGIDVDSKYTQIFLLFETGTAFRINADLQYTSFDIPENLLIEKRYHKDDSKLMYSGETRENGSVATGVVNLKMYEGSLEIH